MPRPLDRAGIAEEGLNAYLRYQARQRYEYFKHPFVSAFSKRAWPANRQFPNTPDQKPDRAGRTDKSRWSDRPAVPDPCSTGWYAPHLIDRALPADNWPNFHPSCMNIIVAVTTQNNQIILRIRPTGGMYGNVMQLQNPRIGFAPSRMIPSAKPADIIN